MGEAVTRPNDAQAQDRVPFTLTAYAKRRGVSVKAVSVAVSTGRLVASVGRDDHNRPTILDPELADREWERNTRTRIDRAGASGSSGPPSCPPEVVPGYNASRAAHASAAARRYAAQAEIAEMTLAERRGELIRIDDARADLTAKLTLLRTRLLGVPSRLGQEFPDIAAKIVPIVEDRIREALEELANADTDSEVGR